MEKEDKGKPQCFNRIFPGLISGAVFFLAITVTAAVASGQSWHIGIATGLMNYQGELKASRLTYVGVRPSVYVGIRRTLGEYWHMSSGITAGSLTGQDADNPTYYTRRRNLHFETGIYEYSFMGAFRLFNLADGMFKSHVSLGAAMFWVDPYTRDLHGNKYKLYDLSLEGQGLNEYPGLVKPRHLNLALPYAINLSARLTESLDLELEFNLRKTFTDQIDAVSGAYPLESSLRSARGDLAVALSYRTDELTGEELRFPPEGTMRGNPKTKDWYYEAMLRFVWKFRDRYAYDVYPGSHRLFKPGGWPYRW